MYEYLSNMNDYDIEAKEQVIGFMYAGMPGSGKTTVAQMAAELTNGSYHNTGQMVRDMAEEEHVDVGDSEKLGEWAARIREEGGDGAVSTRLVGEFLRGQIDYQTPVHIDGVRNYAGVMEWRQFFTTSFLVLVQAPFELRLERIRERGRDGEEGFTEVDLLERDARELNDLGTATILESDEVDYTIENDSQEIGELHAEVQHLTNNYTSWRTGMSI